MNILDIENALKNEEASPPDLAQFGTILAGYYSYYANMMKRILINKDAVCLRIQDYNNWLPNEEYYSKRDKPLSDKKTERIWNTTKEGQAEIALEWELKRIEKMMQQISRRLYIDNVAAKTSNY